MITHKDIDITNWKEGVKKISFSIYTSNNLEPLHLKTEFLATVYGEKDKEIRLLKERLEGKKPASEVSKNDIARDIKDIQKRVADYFYINVKALRSKSRKKNLVVARHVAMYISRQQGYSLPTIGEAFTRDHATVINAVRNIEKQLKTDKNLNRIIEEVI